MKGNQNMFGRPSILRIRILQAAALAAVSLMAARPGQAAAARTHACAAAYRAGLPLKDAGQLIEARDAFLECTEMRCSTVLRSQCMRQVEELTESIPSVVPVLTDQTGALVTPVEVIMDGTRLTSQADGRAISVNPGDHQFAFKTERDGVVAERKVMLLPGQRNRPVQVSVASARRRPVPKEGVRVAAPSPAVVREAPVAAPSRAVVREEPAAAPSRAVVREEPAAEEAPSGATVATSGAPAAPGKSRVGAYLLGGLGLVGLGGWGMFTYWARRDNVELDTCAPDCPVEAVNHIKRMYLFADISVGVGIAALALSTWRFVAAGRSPTREVATRRRPYVLDVAAAPSGAMATVSGGF
jgi:hypothetical protein